MRTSGPARALAAAALLAIAAGCSASASSSTGQAGGSSPSASSSQGTAAGTSVSGHDSPQAVVSGMSNAELSGNWAQVCSFWMPAQQASCKGMKLAHTPTGKVTVGNAVVSGDLALVGVIGKVCLAKNQCQGNTDPSAGMPTGSVTFQQAYDKDLHGTAFSPVPCIRVNGKWYLNTSTM